MMGVSLRAYARMRGCSLTAVQKAIASKRISTLPDGTIDPERANQDWEKNTFAGQTIHQGAERTPTGARVACRIGRSCYRVSAGPRSQRELHGKNGAVGV